MRKMRSSGELEELYLKVKSWVSLLPPLTLTNVLEIVILAFFVYEILLWIRESRAWSLLRGLLVVAAFIAFAAILNLTTILWIIERISTVAIIVAALIFQPELRRVLEQLGSRSYFAQFFVGQHQESAIDHAVNDMVKACFSMGKVKTGALIVIQQTMHLMGPDGKSIEESGIQIDGLLSDALLINIFEKNTPLHDGAVVVVGDRVMAATCYLPLSNADISKDYGTRHRAALGISEVSDAITLVVSEETGHVSVTRDGQLLPMADANALRSYLQEHIVKTETKQEEAAPFFRFFKRGKTKKAVEEGAAQGKGAAR